MAMLSTPAPGPTYVAIGISVGSETTPAETSTGAVPSNSATAPASATIETSTVSGDVTMGTRRLRSSACASAGQVTSAKRTPSAMKGRRDIRASELASVRTAGQDGIFGAYAHSTPHTRVYGIGDSWDDPARE